MKQIWLILTVNRIWIKIFSVFNSGGELKNQAWVRFKEWTKVCKCGTKTQYLSNEAEAHGAIRVARLPNSTQLIFNRRTFISHAP